MPRPPEGSPREEEPTDAPEETPEELTEEERETRRRVEEGRRPGSGSRFKKMIGVGAAVIAGIVGTKVAENTKFVGGSGEAKIEAPAEKMPKAKASTGVRITYLPKKEDTKKSEGPSKDAERLAAIEKARTEVDTASSEPGTKPEAKPETKVEGSGPEAIITEIKKRELNPNKVKKPKPGHEKKEGPAPDKIVQVEIPIGPALPEGVGKADAIKRMVQGAITKKFGDTYEAHIATNSASSKKIVAMVELFEKKEKQ